MNQIEKNIMAFLPVEEIEEVALSQILMTGRLPFVKHLSVMADAHAGKGSCVGTVIATKGAVIPAAVGVN